MVSTVGFSSPNYRKETMKNHVKDCGYSGSYHDPDISIGLLLENPAEYDLPTDTLAFSVTVKSKDNSMSKPRGWEMILPST